MTPDIQNKKSATQILNEYGIDIMMLNDDFNSQLLHAMEEYASLTRSEYEEKIKALEGKIKSMMNL